MTTPTVDIIVPVWNSPFETRACLSAILTHSPEARLIVVDNGSNRETQVMLEEFSEPLCEQGLFITSERNLGLVPAINIGLGRSDSEYAIIIRPHVRVIGGWLTRLLEAAQNTQAGLVSPLFKGAGAPLLPPLPRNCSLMETFDISFSALGLKREMSQLLGGFDEGLDGGAWCLKDYIRRAWNSGFRTCVTSSSTVVCDKEAVFGSENRRQEQARLSQARYLERWGIGRHYAVYFGSDATAGNLTDAVEIITDGARQGHRFSLLLHHRQAADFRRMGWNSLHTGIEIHSLSMLMPQRDFVRKLTALQAATPDIVPVQGLVGVSFPGVEAAIPFCNIAAAI